MLLHYIFITILEKLISPSFKDGTLHLSLTKQCNANCTFCKVKDNKTAPKTMNKTWLYTYFCSLYKQAKQLVLTGGECTNIPEGLTFCKFIHEKYPHLSVMLQTNGITFDEKWQTLAVDNLMHIHFSINAAQLKTYLSGVWPGLSGKKAYNTINHNLKKYIQLLDKKKLLPFAPSISMVINKNTAKDVRAFVKKALQLKTSACIFYFDYKENNMATNYFAYPKTSIPALTELIKISKVLDKKFFVYFQLFIPLEQYHHVYINVKKIPFKTLKTEYADLVELAQNRSIDAEYLLRQKIREKHHKKNLSLEEECKPTLKKISLGGKKFCFAPWKELFITPSGEFGVCSWRKKPLKIQDYIKKNLFQWNSAFTSLEFKKIRKDILLKKQANCMLCCPSRDSNNY